MIADTSQLDQYLGRYAEPEAALAGALDDPYQRVLIVPARQEAPDLLDGFLPAAAAAAGRTLCVLIVNDTAVSPEGSRSLHGLLDRLERPRAVSSAPPAWLGRLAELEALIVDRSSHGFTLPEKQGVGLARKIGCDLAVALWRAGNLETPILYCSDADAVLPQDYFEAGKRSLAGAAGGVYPFWHQPSGDVEIDRATASYEIALRYYVLGLRAARSPYAMHTIGSTLGIDARAYALVRGFPRRAAGEDFYMLAKSAKVGPIVDVEGSPVGIRSRRSRRVPFGTGRGVERLLEGEALSLYDPECFTLLRQMIEALDRFAAESDVQGFAQTLARAPASGAPSLVALARDWQLPDVLVAAAEQSKGSEQLRRRLHTWFDAFRTLKLVHALQQRGLPPVPWRAAFERAAFLPRNLATETDLDAIRTGLVALERNAAGPWGPTCLPRL